MKPPPFFKPSDWDGPTEAIMFTSPFANNNNNKQIQETTKKNKKKQKAADKKKKGPFAAPPAAPTAKKGVTNNKVKTGRIEKLKNNAKVEHKQSRKIHMTPALAEAAAAFVNQNAMEVGSTTMTVDEQTNNTNTLFAAKLKSELMGGRFRYLNEQLYTMNSRKAVNLFEQDRESFNAYHEGYRHQVEKWPMNPLKRIIKTISRLPKSLEIGDFGCGEGKLAESVPHKVHSMDLVSTRPDIIACDITNTPLAAQSLDVAVYCLSLMGTNLNDFFLEANRVLKLHGNVYISEIQSRFEDVRQFVRAMNACGFDLIKKDVAVNYFYFFHFKKMRHVGKVAKLQPFSLKPCLYRKR